MKTSKPTNHIIIGLIGSLGLFTNCSSPYAEIRRAQEEVRQTHQETRPLLRDDEDYPSIASTHLLSLTDSQASNPPAASYQEAIPIGEPPSEPRPQHAVRRDVPDNQETGGWKWVSHICQKRCSKRNNKVAVQGQREMQTGQPVESLVTPAMPLKDILSYLDKDGHINMSRTAQSFLAITDLNDDPSIERVGRLVRQQLLLPKISIETWEKLGIGVMSIETWEKLGIAIPPSDVPEIPYNLLAVAKEEVVRFKKSPFLTKLGQKPPLLALDLGKSIEELTAECLRAKGIRLLSNAAPFSSETWYKQPGTGLQWILLPPYCGIAPYSPILTERPLTNYAQLHRVRQILYPLYPGYQLGNAREMLHVALLNYQRDPQPPWSSPGWFPDRTCVICKNPGQSGDWQRDMVMLGASERSYDYAFYSDDDLSLSFQTGLKVHTGERMYSEEIQYKYDKFSAFFVHRGE